jgi:hypothetical protein
MLLLCGIDYEEKNIYHIKNIDFDAEATFNTHAQACFFMYCNIVIQHEACKITFMSVKITRKLLNHTRACGIATS